MWKGRLCTAGCTSSASQARGLRALDGKLTEVLGAQGRRNGDERNRNCMVPAVGGAPRVVVPSERGKEKLLPWCRSRINEETVEVGAPAVRELYVRADEDKQREISSMDAQTKMASKTVFLQLKAKVLQLQEKLATERDLRFSLEKQLRHVEQMCSFLQEKRIEQEEVATTASSIQSQHDDTKMRNKNGSLDTKKRDHRWNKKNKYLNPNPGLRGRGVLEVDNSCGDREDEPVLRMSKTLSQRTSFCTSSGTRTPSQLGRNKEAGRRVQRASRNNSTSTRTTKSSARDFIAARCVVSPSPVEGKSRSKARAGAEEVAGGATIGTEVEGTPSGRRTRARGGPRAETTSEAFTTPRRRPRHPVREPGARCREEMRGRRNGSKKATTSAGEGDKNPERGGGFSNLRRNNSSSCGGTPRSTDSGRRGGKTDKTTTRLVEDAASRSNERSDVEPGKKVLADSDPIVAQRTPQTRSPVARRAGLSGRRGYEPVRLRGRSKEGDLAQEAIKPATSSEMTEILNAGQQGGREIHFASGDGKIISKKVENNYPQQKELQLPPRGRNLLSCFDSISDLFEGDNGRPFEDDSSAKDELLSGSQLSRHVDELLRGMHGRRAAAPGCEKTA
ncbi:unnamed protein product [Amoebophrya sp. A120]|nr:unnamed protein product [Amoebophrya sp. A120]|eukprot:GSA120T00009857001.1